MRSWYLSRLSHAGKRSVPGGSTCPLEFAISKNFSIDFIWLPREHGSPVERLTLAEIEISGGGWMATELEDYQARTVRPSMRVSAYALAQWLAYNWWRLRWEPETERSPFSWRMSHQIGASGEGYLWPDLTFISDGESVRLRCRSAATPAERQPLRYLNSFDVTIPAGDFEQGIDSFLDGVVGRLASDGAGAAELKGLWDEVLRERRDPELTAWRRLEAVMGYDPGEAADTLVNELQRAGTELGVAAVEEVAAASGEKALANIKELCGRPREEAAAIRINRFDELSRRIQREIPPSLLSWQKATEAARMARQVWSVGSGAVATKDLCEFFDVSTDLIKNPSLVKAPMHAGFRQEGAALRVFLNSPYPANRRFSLLRIVGDHLNSPPPDRLLPAPAKVSTHRQKFQRAFAQEFLCPCAELVAYLGPEVTSDEAIEDAAHHFDVSQL
ncbi:MAG: hypothetical protein OEV91_10130, partial [Desulfobulbaceae bacterium]|nr:hypothetical protein [Desulfobulbaceae bacterium]